MVTTGVVIKVVDGDTIDVKIGGDTYKVRYIGMDTPEIEGKVEPYGPEAAQANQDLVGGKVVTLIKDKSETDRYGRLLRYVIVGDVFVNETLVRRGFARASSYPPDVACDNTFREAEDTARNIELGIWGLAPSRAATLSLPTPGNGGNCDPAYPQVCIPSPPPELDCKDIPYRNFKVLPPDPHNFDGNHDGVGCEGQ